MQYTFGDIVIVEDNLIGVVVKSWCKSNRTVEHEVYVRNYNEIKTYKESEMQRYMVRHKYLSEEEKDYQYNAIHPFATDDEIERFMKILKECEGAKKYTQVR
jgi:t-SNARE complex subunit (syntaxin)